MRGGGGLDVYAGAQEQRPQGELDRDDLDDDLHGRRQRRPHRRRSRLTNSALAR